jgi:hypothetical protein
MMAYLYKADKFPLATIKTSITPSSAAQNSNLQIYKFTPTTTNNPPCSTKTKQLQPDVNDHKSSKQATTRNSQTEDDVTAAEDAPPLPAVNNNTAHSRHEHRTQCQWTGPT